MNSFKHVLQSLKQAVRFVLKEVQSISYQRIGKIK